MRMKRVLQVFALALSWSIMSSAHATLIVDTGPGPATGTFNARDISYHHWEAGLFTINQPATITGIQVWMYQDSTSTSGTLTAFICEDRIESSGFGDYHMLGSGIVYQDFTIDPKCPPDWGYDLSLSTVNWYGPSDLNTYLAPGSYWVGFKVQEQGDPGFLGFCPTPLPNPLALYADNWSDLTNAWGQRYWTNPALDPIGIRIYADLGGGEPEVPIAGTLLLLGSGLLGLAGLGWKQRES